MNKAFKKYGKVSFKSIIPKRLKAKRAIRIAMSAAFLSSSYAQISAIAFTNSANKLGKSIALAGAIAKSAEGLLKCMTRSDHPIHKKAAN